MFKSLFIYLGCSRAIKKKLEKYSEILLNVTGLYSHVHLFCCYCFSYFNSFLNVFFNLILSFYYSYYCSLLFYCFLLHSFPLVFSSLPFSILLVLNDSFSLLTLLFSICFSSLFFSSTLFTSPLFFSLFFPSFPFSLLFFSFLFFSPLQHFFSSLVFSFPFLLFFYSFLSLICISFLSRILILPK